MPGYWTHWRIDILALRILLDGHRKTGDQCPFPGLPAFEEKHAGVYFGREEETQTILEDLRKMRMNGEPRLLMIVGVREAENHPSSKAGYCTIETQDRRHRMGCPANAAVWRAHQRATHCIRSVGCEFWLVCS